MTADLLQLEPSIAVLFAVIGVGAIFVAMWIGTVDIAIARMTLAYAEDLVQSGRRGAKALFQVVSQRRESGWTLVGPRAVFQTIGMVTLTWVLSAGLWQVGWPWWGVLLACLAIAGTIQLAAVGLQARLLAGSRYVGVALLGARTTLSMMTGPWNRRPRPYSERLATAPDVRLAALDELRELVDEVAEDGSAASLEDEDRKILRSVFELGQTRVGEVMVPRGEMVVIRGEESAKDALEQFVECGYSRLPVVGKSLDDVQGVLYMKDVARRSLKGEDAMEIEVRDIARAAAFVPEMKLADDELRVMQSTNVHLALVVDEYGGIAGLVTVEDILEELVGELVDEHDQDMPVPEEVAPGRWLVPMSHPIDDLEELLDVEVDEDDVYSVGGLLSKAIGKVPLPGAHAIIGDVAVVAGEATGRRRRVLSAYVSRAYDDGPQVSRGE